jgi:ribosome-associated protein
MDEVFLEIDAETRVRRDELVFRAVRSGGPGGQHVNTSSTKVELIWNLADSPSLTPDQKERARERLGKRIDASGNLRLTASGSRSQARNKDEVTDRFRRALASALAQDKPRRATRPPRSAGEARLAAKRHRAQIKQQRQPPPTSE